MNRLRVAFAPYWQSIQSDYFGQIPHAALMQSIARRVSDGRLLGCQGVAGNGGGGRRRTRRRPPPPHEPGTSRAEGYPARGTDYSPNAKGNFQFDRVILGWRDRPVLDVRLKR